VIEAVRQGQTKRAPIERIMDIITAYFVPVITALAILTWVVWLCLGLSGALPADALSNSVGGWRTS
jgi:cation transport ATPase